MSEQSTAPGWYLDPEALVQLRYHDGDVWTDESRTWSPEELARDGLPAAIDDLEEEATELQRSTRHAAWLLGGSFLFLFLLPMVWMPVLAAVSAVEAKRADRAWRAGQLATARRRHRSARRWRLVTYWSVPVFVTFLLLGAALAVGQFLAG
ncbi:DUF2510 domain-containing protein [Egicoccus sp. AB-alg2]|uniref:DUF2510 domain-containing protein n=1 Tax=Egicoccus sp. AB-alg2 TaxID=3242693 RepID=UPI00359CD4DA